MRQRTVLVQALASTPSDVSRMVRGIDEESARRRPEPGGWSVAEVVGHLAELEERYRGRLLRVVEEDEPRLAALGPREDRHQAAATCQELVARFAESRAETLAFLAALATNAWARKAIHETRGEVRLRSLVEHLLEHDLTHLAQLVEARRRAGRALPTSGRR